MGSDTGLQTLANLQSGVASPFKQPLERETGIEPVSLAWKAKVLPLNYSRFRSTALVEEAGFEPA